MRYTYWRNARVSNFDLFVGDRVISETKLAEKHGSKQGDLPDNGYGAGIQQEPLGMCACLLQSNLPTTSFGAAANLHL